MWSRRSPPISRPSGPTADRLLADARGPVVDRALATALPTASTREHGVLVERLLARRSTRGRLALIRNLHRLEARAAGKVREAADHGLDAAVRRAFESGSDATRNALRLIGERNLFHLAYLAVEAAGRPRPDLAREAAAVLVHLAAGVRPGSRDAKSLAAAVDPAVASWGRGGGPDAPDDVLTAFLLLAGERLPAASAALGDAAHPAAAPLRRRLASASGAAERGALLASLPHEGLREAALAGLAAAARERPFRGVFPTPAVLADPAVRAALAAAPHPGGLCPAAWPSEAATEERRCLVRLLAALRLPDAARDRWLALGLADPDAGVRTEALAAATRAARPASSILAAAAAGVATAAENPAEARVAARLAAAGGGSPEGLARSPHPAVRRVAEEAAAARAAEGVLAGGEGDPAPGLAACLALPGGEAALRARLVPPASCRPARRKRLHAVRRALASLTSDTERASATTEAAA